MNSMNASIHPRVFGTALESYPDLASKALDQVRVRVLSGFGLNCEAEGVAAFEMLGVPATRLHAKELIESASGVLEETDVLVFSGGFSFGDHVAAGRILAQRLRTHCGEALARYLDRGGLALGMCNGFQVMVKMGLLPGLDRSPGALAPQQLSLVNNARLGYRNAWVKLGFDPQSPCVFTRGLTEMACPSRHAEGRLLVQDEAQAAKLTELACIPARYVDAQGNSTEAWPDNPNGSSQGWAGLCDPSGRAFGLMPHPEAFLYAENHPHWRRLAREGNKPARGAGLMIFANALRHVLGS